MKKIPIYFFLRKNVCSVLKTFFHKFVNILMRKGYKNKYIKFFFNLLRVYKRRMITLYTWREKNKNIKLPTKKQILNFTKFSQSVLSKITFELELKSKKYRKKEILIPIPVSPWRGVRLGLNLILKNSKIRIEKIKRHKKIKFLYNLLDELWDTHTDLSLTSKYITEFSENVLTHAQNFRSTQLFPVKKSRRVIIPIKKKIIKKKKLIEREKEKAQKKEQENIRNKNKIIWFNTYFIKKYKRRKVNEKKEKNSRKLKKEVRNANYSSYEQKLFFTRLLKKKKN